MMLIDASWPSNRLAAVTTRTGWVGTLRAFGSSMETSRQAGGAEKYFDVKHISWTPKDFQWSARLGLTP